MGQAYKSVRGHIYGHSMPPSATEQFIEALGIEIVHADPDSQCGTPEANCASYQHETRTLTACRSLCPGRRSIVLRRLLERL